MRLEEREMQAVENRISEMCAELMELGCDSVQIISTAMIEGDACGKCSIGKGNLFARYGAVSEWLEDQKNIGLANELSCTLNGEY